VSQSPFGFIGVSDMTMNDKLAAFVQSQSPFGFIGVSDANTSKTQVKGGGKRSQSPFGFIGVSDWKSPWRMF